MLKMGFLAVALLAAFPASAQHDAAIAARQALILREQQSALFSLQLQQSQQSLDPAPVNGPALDALHLEQMQRQLLLDQEALREGTRFPGYDRARRESDRAALQLQFSARTPAWGPRLQPRHWTPTLE